MYVCMCVWRLKQVAMLYINYVKHSFRSLLLSQNSILFILCNMTIINRFIKDHVAINIFNLITYYYANVKYECRHQNSNQNDYCILSTKFSTIHILLMVMVNGMPFECMQFSLRIFDFSVYQLLSSLCHVIMTSKWLWKLCKLVSK